MTLDPEDYVIGPTNYVPVLPITQGRFLTPLRVEVLGDRDPSGRELFLVLEPFVYHSAVAQRTITVPAGFVFDGESIPPIARSFAGDPSLRAGCVHDWLYASHLLNDRDLDDKVYREVLLADNVHVVDADKKYGAVSTYGERAWATGPDRLRMERVT